MPWGVAAAVVGVAGSMYSANQQSKSNQRAADRADPFYYHREQYANQLDDLMRDPSKVTSTPGYQFNLSQGEQAITRQQAASGAFGSGQMGTALVKYSEDYAQNSWSQYANMLYELAGGSSKTNQAAAVQGGANEYKANQQTFSSVGGLMGTASNYFGGGGFGG